MPIDENSVLLVSDRRTVKRFDLVHGQTSWVYRESEQTARHTGRRGCWAMPNACWSCTTAIC